MFRWEWAEVGVALELVPTPIGMLGSDVPRSTAGHIRDGVSEHLSSCSGGFAEQGPGGKTGCMLM